MHRLTFRLPSRVVKYSYCSLPGSVHSLHPLFVIMFVAPCGQSVVIFASPYWQRFKNTAEFTKCKQIKLIL
jgi:hypothetical protein